MLKGKWIWIGKNKIKKNTEVVILCHESITKDVIAFDVLIRKSVKKKKPRLYQWLKNQGYEIEGCKVVKLFLKIHKDFEYVCGEDFAHILFFYVGVLDTLLQISRKFRTVVVLFEIEEGDLN